MRFAPLLLCAILLCTAPFHAAHAQSVPVPGNKVSLETLEEKLAREKAESQALQKKVKNVEAELSDTRKSLVRLADKIRENENDLRRLQSRITQLSAEEKEHTARLEEDYGAIADLVVALERLNRVPPESLLARPGAPLDTAQSALLLRSVLPGIHKRAEQLSSDLDRLARIRADMERDRAALDDTRIKLATERSDLAGLVGKRETLLKTTRSDYDQSKKAVERAAREAQSLRDLMARLAQEEEDAQTRRQASAAAAGKRAPRPVPVPKAGAPRLPAGGEITVSYGETDNIGAKSQGIHVETSASALVVAPMGGVVKFAGDFKNYGQMVIVEHQDRYHSLIGGLGKIDVAIGQAVSAGEPIGKMPSLSSSSRALPALYYELRHKGQPVNPSKKFELSKIGNAGT